MPLFSQDLYCTCRGVFSSCFAFLLEFLPPISDDEMSADGDSEVGRRSSSPPGRESRDEWKKGERQADMSHSTVTDKERSRSRSPRSKSPPFKKAKRENRGAPRFFRDGTNTVRDEPHLQRARLFVGNIEPNKTERRDIIDLFSRHGEVLGVSVHKGYAFVQMDRERNANRAINYEDNQNFLGSRIRKWMVLILLGGLRTSL